MSKKIQEDGHAALIGYAMDGFGLYEQLDINGKEPTDLDAVSYTHLTLPTICSV